MTEPRWTEQGIQGAIKGAHAAGYEIKRIANDSNFIAMQMPDQCFDLLSEKIIKFYIDRTDRYLSDQRKTVWDVLRRKPQDELAPKWVAMLVLIDEILSWREFDRETLQAAETMHEEDQGIIPDLLADEI